MSEELLTTNPLLAEKMSLENQWNAQYVKQGIYTTEMKTLEDKIETLKKALILYDIKKAKESRWLHQSLNLEQHLLHLEHTIPRNSPSLSLFFLRLHHSH